MGKQIKIGQVFTRLTVLEKLPNIKGKTVFKCKCTCGSVTHVLGNNLKRKLTKSCGCLKLELATKNLLHQTFNSWTVIGTSDKRTKSGALYWSCQCKCGLIKDISSASLLLGTSKSCRTCSIKDNKKRYCAHNHDTSIWGRTSGDGACKACMKNKFLVKKYGITLEEFIILYNAQNGKCCICHNDLGSYVKGQPNYGVIEVDHNHKISDKRKSVRGLLCGGKFKGCNYRLGKRDDAVWFQSAGLYLASPPAQNILKEGGE